MNTVYKFICGAFAAVLLTACVGDNYPQPNASLYGHVIDPETGERILQDIGSEGSKIEIIQQGYSSTSSQYLNFKTDGTFCDKNMFSGTYLLKAYRTNFVAISESTITVNGDTEFNITAKPYCRISVKSLQFLEDKQRVEAKFTVSCTTDDALKEIGLFCDPNRNVSYSINNYGSRDCRVEVGRVLSGVETFTIKMPVTALDSADYYFRIGALSDHSEARYNYTEAVRLHIAKKDIPQKEKGIRWDLFDHFEYWYKHKTIDRLEWDTKDYKTGGGSVSSTSMIHEEGAGYTQFITPGDESGGIRPRFDASSIPFEGCHMLLTLFVSDANHFERSANGQIEIGSAGIYDSEELCWTFDQFTLRDGWQTLDLPLNIAFPMGEIRMGKIDWFRIYHLKETGPTTLKCDEVRFYYNTLVDGCEDTADWRGESLSLDEVDFKQGEASISARNKSGQFIIEKKYSKSYYAPAKKENGYFQLWVYVSDASAFNATGDGQIEITSSGQADVNELAWPVPSLNSGWNKVILKLSDGITRGGDINLKAVNYFRIWKNMQDVAQDALTVKVDGIRFYQEGYAPEDEED